MDVSSFNIIRHDKVQAEISPDKKYDKNVTKTLMPTITQSSNTFSASKLLLISAPSILVCRSALDVSAPRSFPVTTACFSQLYYTQH